MKSEAAKKIREKIRAIKPVFVEWERNPNQPRELYLVDVAKCIQTPVTDVISADRLEGWPLTKDAFTAPVAIQIIKQPITLKFSITSCPSFAIAPIRHFFSQYKIVTQLSLFSKTPLEQAAQIQQFGMDETQLIYGMSKRSAQAALWELRNRLHIAHYINRDAEKGMPREIIESRAIVKAMTSHNRTGEWKIAAWMLWDQFNRNDILPAERATVISQMTGCEVTEQAIRSAAKEVNLSLGES